MDLCLPLCGVNGGRMIVDVWDYYLKKAGGVSPSGLMVVWISFYLQISSMYAVMVFT